MDSHDSVDAVSRRVRTDRTAPTATGQRERTAPRWPDSRAATKLWARMIGVRADGLPRLVAELEEALFRFYTPLAHLLADNDGAAGHDDRARRLAEFTLAKAIRVWPLPDEAWFEEYARNAIRAEFLNHPGLTGPPVSRARVRSTAVRGMRTTGGQHAVQSGMDRV